MGNGALATGPSYGALLRLYRSAIAVVDPRHDRNRMDYGSGLEVEEFGCERQGLTLTGHFPLGAGLANFAKETARPRGSQCSPLPRTRDLFVHARAGDAELPRARGRELGRRKHDCT